MTTPPPGSQPEPSDRPEPGYPAQSYPAPDQPAGLSGYQSYPGGADPYARYGDHYAEAPGGGPEGDPLVPRDFGGWFQRIIGVIKRSFPQLALLALITAVVGVLSGLLVLTMLPSQLTSGSGFPGDPATGGLTPDQLATLGDSAGSFFAAGAISWVISIVVNAFVLGASIFVAVRDAAGRPTSAVEGLRFVVGRVGPLIAWYVLAVVIIMIGFVLLIIPGVYLVVALVSLPAVVVVERGGLARCFALIKNRWWATFGRLLVAGIIGAVYYFVVRLIAVAVGGGPLSATTAIIQAILFIPVTVASAAVIVVTYAELRSHQPDGADTRTLAAQLER